MQREIKCVMASRHDDAIKIPTMQTASRVHNATPVFRIVSKNDINTSESDPEYEDEVLSSRSNLGGRLSIALHRASFNAKAFFFLSSNNLAAAYLASWARNSGSSSDLHAEVREENFPP
jgi:hypothetical protein